ncbi:hypothetical protein AL062_02780 [Pseudomonas syringae pv. syringae]|uniref:DUF2971 domain-containing protein n=1 Tax=Pseudomonas syringae TaxID=317 RepID=UPI00076021A3|nr:DUF2971 domain-containing protein [Pseudomonas syringae]KWS20859.1 hypothetical protein AL062_02780 [Pseudomonas syringae pv. syringae]
MPRYFKLHLKWRWIELSNSSAISAGRLYRILDFARAVQIFESKSLYFAHPQVWDDPYEVSIEHQSSHALFAQCWCRLGVSDAMWRIYSPNQMGVRISTSTKKLNQALRDATISTGYHLETGPVEYLTQHALDLKIRMIAGDLRAKFELSKAAKALLMKREAFTHESEWRAVIYCPDINPVKIHKGISLAVNPHKLIDSILLDPRAPQELIDAFTYYFKEKIKFKGRVSRSVLYKSPQRIQLVDDS